ncbi:hypothetical protein [Agromyces bauzanensis]
MTPRSQLERDLQAAADHLDSLARPLTYDEFVREIAVAVPQPSSDVHWMADNQLVNIFFARQTADPSTLTSRFREWIPAETRWTAESLRTDGFEGFLPFAALPQAGVPKLPGVYVVLRAPGDRPQFLERSIAGWFKGKDSTVDVGVLRDAWIDDSEILYIGRANWGKSEDGLRRRLSEYRRHGEGKPVGHRGGEYIWQIANSDRLLVCWKTTSDDEVKALEARLIDEFEAAFGRWPFANRKRESRRH